jgi:3-ketosteroid 9alpha-monooxygenase subunit B
VNDIDLEQVRSRHGFHKVRVARVQAETHDAATFVLALEPDQRSLFSYQPGQFCTVRVRIGDEEHLRCYSMSSSPATDRDMALTVKRVPGGRVSNWLIDQVREGDLLELSPPAGSFCPRGGDRPIVAFCGGSGITPVMSIIRAELHSGRRPVRLLYANRDRSSVIFAGALKQLAAEHPDRFELRFHHDEDSGLVKGAEIREFLAGQTDIDAYVCGPAAFMDLVETALIETGVDPHRIEVERFDRPIAGHADPGSIPSRGKAPETVTIIFEGTTHLIPYQVGDSLLATARRGGLAAPFSCEAGNCATCMARVVRGSAEMRVNDALTDDEVAAGWVLTCQAVPVTAELTVEYERL